MSDKKVLTNNFGAPVGDGLTALTAVERSIS